MKAKRFGVAGVKPSVPSGALYLEAQLILKTKAEKSAARKAERYSRPVPNWKCYPMVFIVGKNIDHNGNWLGGRLPKCRVCEERLHPKENHVCSGFKPKYVEHDEAWHERQEAKRAEIRASKRRIITCSGCGAEIESQDETRWHDEHCEQDRDSWRSEHYAINGDEDDLSGYEDEPEEDYCEGDDDGYDCD